MQTLVVMVDDVNCVKKQDCFYNKDFSKTIMIFSQNICAKKLIFSFEMITVQYLLSREF